MIGGNDQKLIPNVDGIYILRRSLKDIASKSILLQGVMVEAQASGGEMRVRIGLLFQCQGHQHLWSGLLRFVNMNFFL